MHRAMTEHLQNMLEEDELWVENLISRYIEENGGEPIGLFEINLDGDQVVNVCIADWVIEMSDYFDEKYGSEKGLEVTKIVVGKCLSRGQTLH